MKHLRPFNLLNENHQSTKEVDLIVGVMQDFLDDDRKILFRSSNGDMNYTDYVDKNNNYLNFKPVINNGKYIRSQFSIVFQDIKDYKDFLSMLNEMQAAIGRLKDSDWSLYDMKLGTSAPLSNQGNVNFSFLALYFSKPDQEIQGGSFVYPTKEQLAEVFKRWGLVIQDLDWMESKRPNEQESELCVEFYTQGYRGEVPKNIEDCFDLTCDKFGFNSYNYDFGELRVWFIFNFNSF